ncbi:MAG: recombinase family protein [Planctomycetota bacterium]|nr:MAG: recombinase family protein [Planctomycetota bacterium]
MRNRRTVLVRHAGPHVPPASWPFHRRVCVTPAGRMQRRVLASMASFYTEQQSLDVREGLARRVQSGLFVGKPPFGYRNIRINGRSIVEIHTENAAIVRRAFELYANHNHTVDTLVEALFTEGMLYSATMPKFTRSKLYTLLTDRAYIGEIRHKDQWLPGTHHPIVDRATWDRVQKLLGQGLYRSHQMTYASELIECGHCGCPITGESKTKKTKSGNREYVYYRCTKYHKGDHPRIRLTEGDLDAQMLALFDKLRVEDAEFRDTFREQLRKVTNWDQDHTIARAKELEQELATVREHQKRLLNLRLLEEIEADTYAMKAQELRDRESELKLQIDSADRNRHEIIDTAIKAFELSQNLRAKWFAADWTAKRRILEIVCLNWKLDGVSLVPEWRKPFDLLAERLLTKDSRDNCRIFEPWTPARDAFATAFFGQREPHLNELWAMSENSA